MKMSLMTAPTQWLHEISRGTIKTMWGQMMKATDPVEKMDKIYEQMVERGHDKIVALAFVEIAPILAERLAIAQYAKKNPQIRTIAPEILSYQEALQIATKDHWLTKRQQKELLTLLMNHYSMKAL